MATYTTRNDLIKPEYTDAADIHDLNDNFDFIDGSIAPCSWNKTTAPTINDDVTYGYIIGSLWFDITNHKLYICESNTDGAAVWRQLYPGGITPVSTASDPTVNDDSGDGYAVGQTWINTSTKQFFVATDVTVGAAVWRKMIAADGTVPLTANWDVGAFEIRAQTFQSDVATGTAPFTVASTTRVSNLNAATCGDADTLDSLQSTAFAILAGQSGGQTLYGGTAASNNLTLYGSSHATQGVVKIPQGGLELGTKATTATYGAINIHEGASGAANAINFLDGDGSTIKASVSKDSSDNLLLGAGGTTVYVSGSAGRLVAQAGISTDLSPTDGSASSNIAMTNRPVWTADATHTFYGIYDAIFPEIRTGKTQSGSALAYYTECMRNHNGASTDDDGSLGNLIAFRAVAGHYSLNSSMKGTTTNAYCFYVSPFCNKGTITSLYGIYIANVSSGGTITNSRPFYSDWNAQHYFGGDIYTVGNCSALSFTDRTPGYDGDARAELRKVKNTPEGHIDHETIPAFARVKIEGKPIVEETGRKIIQNGTEIDEKNLLGSEEEDGRDLGAMISILVKAVQQLDAENTAQASQIDALQRKHDDAERRMAKLEARLAKHGI